MTYLENYLDLIRSRGNLKLADSIETTADDVTRRHIETFDYVSHEVGLLFGNIQSGKTAQMFGIICSAADHGFHVFILLTADNNTLELQTLERVRADLKDFLICGENDARLYEKNQLVKPTVIVLKKHVDVLKHWADVLLSTGFLAGNPLFVLDDEADAASLNTRVNSGRQSGTNKYIEKIRNTAFSSIYLQVTGTPQAILLQTAYSNFRPSWVQYFEPGKEYLGGKFFFPLSGMPSCIRTIDHDKEPLRTAVVRHLTVSAQILLSGGRVSCFICHPGASQKSHEEHAAGIQRALHWCRTNPGKFKDAVKNEWNRMEPLKSVKRPLDAILAKATELISNSRLIVMNGKHLVDSSQYSSGCVFVVGGNSLGRGVTFPSLQTIYYTRTAKKPQADTMWQHSRIFGYDRDPGLVQVFITEKLYYLFREINSVNDALINQVKNGIDGIHFTYYEGVSPTRKNVIDKKNVLVIPGGHNYFPDDPSNDTKTDIDALLSDLRDDVPSYTASLAVMRRILLHIKSDDAFDPAGYVDYLNSILAEDPNAQGVLIVRRNRHITQGTGALLSPNDYKLAESNAGKVVLVMYEVDGAGWKQNPIWVPDIRIPDNSVYYGMPHNG